MQNGKVGLAVVFNIFKTVQPFIQMKSHGEPQYIEEFEADGLVKARKGVGQGTGCPEVPSGNGTP